MLMVQPNDDNVGRVQNSLVILSDRHPACQKRARSVRGSENTVKLSNSQCFLAREVGVWCTWEFIRERLGVPGIARIHHHLCNAVGEVKKLSSDKEFHLADVRFCCTAADPTDDLKQRMMSHVTVSTSTAKPAETEVDIVPASTASRG